MVADCGVGEQSAHGVVDGVKAWYSANWRSPAGIVAVDTNPLPRNASKIRIIAELLAVSTLLAANPSRRHDLPKAQRA